MNCRIVAIPPPQDIPQQNRDMQMWNAVVPNMMNKQEIYKENIIST